MLSRNYCASILTFHLVIMVSAEEFEPAALSLILDSNRRIYNAGGTIEGEVLLYIPKVLEMHITGCNITLRGSVRTYVVFIKVARRAYGLTLALGRSHAILSNGRLTM